MRQKKSGTREFSSLKRLTRHTTYRLNASIAHELDVHSMVRRMYVGDVTSQRAIVEVALSEWFENNPLPKDLRAAAEKLMPPQGGE